MNTYFHACEGKMTFDKLSQIIDKYNIPHSVVLLSDSGWECDPTEMCGVRYSVADNTLIFTIDNGYETDNGSKIMRFVDYYYNDHLCENLTLCEA